jgi:3-methyladenine DNA glycosylase AlkD
VLEESEELGMDRETRAEIGRQVGDILKDYDRASPIAAADRVRLLWLQFEPKSIDAIKAEQRAKQETVGIPVPVLKAIGLAIGRQALRASDRPMEQRVAETLPLACLLWDSYGREGRVVAVHPLGQMELGDPETVIPVLMQLCRTCLTWEDADQLAMNALEPIVRKDPDEWLRAIEPWLLDENKWVRRAGITVVARLPMKFPAYTSRCLGLAEMLLLDEEIDVKRAVSFAIRLSARGDLVAVREFLTCQVPPEDLAATWVLCDAIRSMAKKLLPEFHALLPHYERWAAEPDLSPRDRRSVLSAVSTLQKAGM